MHLMDHEKVNSDLARLIGTDGLDIQLSYDKSQRDGRQQHRQSSQTVEDYLLRHVYQMYIPVLSPCRQKCAGQQDEFREDAQEVYSGS